MDKAIASYTIDTHATIRELEDAAMDSSQGEDIAAPKRVSR